MQSSTPAAGKLIPQASEPKPAPKPVSKSEPDALPCPICGTPIEAPRGSKAAICRVCGFKDSCCY